MSWDINKILTWQFALLLFRTDEREENRPQRAKTITFVGSALLLRRGRHSHTCTAPWRTTSTKQNSLGLERRAEPFVHHLDNQKHHRKLYSAVSSGSMCRSNRYRKTKWKKELPLYVRVRNCWGKVGDVKKVRDVWACTGKSQLCAAVSSPVFIPRETLQAMVVPGYWVRRSGFCFQPHS